MRIKSEPASSAAWGRTRGANRRNDPTTLETQASLLRASLVLRGIRQRYETGRIAYPEARRYSVQVAMDSGDMGWITAAIESVERALAGAPPRRTRAGNRPPVAVVRRADENLAEETAQGAAADQRR